ncbi:MAG: hypothetical protein QOH48_720 [Actinomycetota bacterium]|nr:hypothetical protein [Actinomycetota bacterium]
MTRRNGPMSIAAVGLLVLVGGASLVLFVLVAQHLAPPATLHRPRIIVSNSNHRAQPAAPFPKLSGRHAGDGRHKVASVITGFSTPGAGDLTTVALFTPSPAPSGSGSSSAGGSGAGTPTGPSSPGPQPTPSPAPSLSPSPTPSPTATEPVDEPPVVDEDRWNGCGRSRGHRIHLPQGSRASSTAVEAKGHVLHPCKSQGHEESLEHGDHDGSSADRNRPGHGGRHDGHENQPRDPDAKGNGHITEGSGHKAEGSGHRSKDAGTRSHRGNHGDRPRGGRSGGHARPGPRHPSNNRHAHAKARNDRGSSDDHHRRAHARRHGGHTDGHHQHAHGKGDDRKGHDGHGHHTKKK